MNKTSAQSAAFTYQLSMFTLVSFIALTLWWVFIFLGKTTDAPVNHVFGFIYGGFSLWGALCGFLTASYWGGHKSVMGKTILALSAGLLLQGFGQYSFWVYNYVLKVAVPYPSVSDIGYFGTIPCYIYAALLFLKASGASLSLRSYRGQVAAVVMPLVMVVISYMLFLKNYNFDLSEPLKSFFDFGYPLGQAIYISIALVAFGLSKKYLGGMMKRPILVILGAFFCQYMADYVFVYFQDQYFPASFIDFFYLLAYAVMTLGILQLRLVALKLRR